MEFSMMKDVTTDVMAFLANWVKQGSSFSKVTLEGKIIGIERLIVDLSGGNGGNGQNRGNGTDENDREVQGSKNEIENRN